MKKKVVALLLTLVMLIGIIPAAVYAASDAKVTLTVTPDKETAKAGEEVIFSVSMSTEETLASMAFTTVFPEGLTYVDNSGEIDADAANAFAFDKFDWTEWSERSDVKGDNYINGYGSKSKAGEAVICTFKAVIAEDAQPGEYAVDLTGLDEFADLTWNVFDESDIEVISNPVVVEAEPKVILTVTPEKETAVAGEEVVFSVSMSTEETLASMAFTTVFPEGLTYVDNSGEIDADAANAFAFDKFDWTEWSERSDVKGDNYINGYGSKSKAGDAVICTFKVVVAEDAQPGEYAVELAGLDEFADLTWNVFDTSVIKVVSNALTVVDHVCSADKLTAVEAVEADCENDGNVAYYECECGTKYADEAMSEILQDVIVPALGHTEAEAVIENEVAADCENSGSYDTVVYCSVCGEELSRETTTEDALGHTEAEAVVENNVEADCENAGSYDTVVYCSVCGEELSRETTTVEAHGHTEGEVVYENVSDATCTEGGSGDAVVYCTVCGEELSRETTEVPALGHTEGEAVVENEVAADCVNEGSYDTVVYCSVCGEELSRETTTVEALGHTEAEAVEENRVEADCVNDGSYDTVVYCSVCGEELSRETTTVDALGHTEAEAVEENRVEADCVNDGSYDTVVYCSVCGEELSRETTVIPATGHTYEAVVTAPTCTDKGYTTYTCACSDSYVADYVDALGHTEGEWVEDETVRGQWNLLCSVCGEILDSEIRLVPVEGVELDQDYVETYYVRKAPAFTLTETVLPEDLEKLGYTVTWTSSNEKVATVDEDGNVTTHKRGEAVITVTVEMEDGTTFTDSCNVKVKYTFCQWLIWFFLLGCCWYFV